MNFFDRFYDVAISVNSDVIPVLDAYKEFIASYPDHKSVTDENRFDVYFRLNAIMDQALDICQPPTNSDDELAFCREMFTPDNTDPSPSPTAELVSIITPVIIMRNSLAVQKLYFNTNIADQMGSWKLFSDRYQELVLEA